VVPFYEEFKMLFGEMGYDRYTNSYIMEVVDGLPLIGCMKKNLLPEINFFKESQK
jgi:hypothetical protein